LRRIAAILELLAAGALASAAEPAAPPTFTRNPVATKAGDQVKVDFAVSRETDVSVFIEDGQGKIVRHLVSGVLGENPPAPLKADSLEQSVEWDGKADWGKPAGAGPFKVRVALGLGARYDKVVMGDPMSIGHVHGMAAGPGGTLYAVVGAGAGVPNWGSQRLVALNRDGTFQRTLIPPPSTATKEQIEALGGVPVTVGGRTVPMVTHLTQRRCTAFWSSYGVAMTPGGQFLVLHPDARIGLVDVADSKTPVPFLGPPMLSKFPKASFASCDESRRAYIASSSDGKHAFVHGMAPRYGYQSDPVEPWYAVYRVKLPERSPAEPFFGAPDKPGSDEAHLGARIGGMATDGKGTLLICDPKNNRVVAVSEADGKFAGSFPSEAPELIAADRESGAIYLLKPGKRGTADVVKLSGWRDPRPLAAIHLTAPRDYLTWRMAVDTSAEPAVLWASNGWQLFRIEDLGEKFGDARPIGGADIGDGGFVNLTVDHYRDDAEVYVRSAQQRWTRFNEKTGQTEALRNMGFLSSAAGACLEVGPEGNLYTQAWPQFLHKWDRNGKPLKWGIPFKTPEGVKPYSNTKVENAIFMPVCMVFMTHTLGIRADGHVFAFEMRPIAPGSRHRKALYEYEPSGQRVGGPIVWEASDAVIGPRFDQQGNIYVAEQVRPAGELVPPEFAGVTGPVTAKSRWDWEPRGVPAWYGSILKFSPKGGRIAYQKGHYAWDRTTQAYDGEPKLDPSLKTVDAACFAAGSSEFTFMAVKVTGAEWMHFGISQIFLGKCNCENTRFDVDLFGRVWYPDLGRYRVGVLDTNGNPITTFGSYGNAESAGPDSPVIDPRTGQVRPRRADDPNDLKSPFAEPEIAFAWLIGVGATDNYAYMGDSLNRRLLRAKLVYAAEETAPLP